MTTNSIVLIVVAILVALALVATVVIFSRKFRSERRLLGDTSILDEITADAEVIQRHDDMRAQHEGRSGTTD